MKKVLFTIIIMWVACLYANPQSDLSSEFEKAEITINKISINSPYSDFAPEIVNGKLFFSSIPESPDRKTKRPGFYDLYYTDILDDGKVGNSKKIVNGIDAKFHEGPISFCEKTKELFVSLSNFENSQVLYLPFQVRNVKLKIVMAQQVDTTWIITGEFPYNNPKYSVGHPAISSSGDTLIFVSDMPGGLGETDLYMSIRSGGIWTEPVNLGENINTKGNEFSPFISDNGILFFASNGYSRRNDLDIYAIKLNSFANEEPVKLPEPINSNSDDFDFVLNKGGVFGYLTSTREKINNDDIYLVQIKWEEPEPVIIPLVLDLTVLDAETKAPISSAEVAINEDTKLQTNENGKISFTMAEEVNYKGVVNAEGYLSNSVIFSSAELPEGEYNLVKQIELYEKVIERTFTINNIYYELDKAELRDQAKVELDKLVVILKENKDLKVELGSHTDSRGSDEYNINLSQRRSESCVNYIVSKGIDISRIEARGYGETQLINECDDGIPCSEEQHQMNRRTTFKILEIDDSTSDIIKKGLSNNDPDEILNNENTEDITITELDQQYWIQLHATKNNQDFEKKMPDLKQIILSIGSRVIEEDGFFKFQVGPIRDSITGIRTVENINEFGYEALLLKYKDNTKIEAVKFME